jgi:hypothetical protein
MPRRGRAALIVLTLLGLAIPLALGALIWRVPTSNPGAILPFVWVIAAASLGLAILVIARLFARALDANADRTGATPAPTQVHAVPRALGSAAGGGFFFLAIVVLSLIRGGSALAAILHNLPMLLLFVGLGLIPFAIRHIGTDKHCRRCGYRMDPEVAADGDPLSRCPECGSYWNSPRGFTVGRRVRRPAFIIAGVLIAVFGVALIPLEFSSAVRGLRTSALPTSSLIAEVTGAPRGFTMDEWSELNKRTLSPEQQVTLARGLLDLRARRGYVDRDAEAWLSAKAAANTLPPDLRDRAYRELVSLAIDVPAHARVGEPVTLKIAAQDRGTYYLVRGAPAPYILFSGFDVPGYEGTGPDATVNAAVSIGGVTTHEPHPAPCTFTPTKPGPQTVEADYWIIVAPAGSLPRTIRWTAACEPILPRGIVWQERRTLQSTIQIDP